MGRFLCGDCLDIMNTIDSGSIDFIMTSPPYADQIKDYGEKVKKIDPNNYVEWFLPRAREMHRVLKDTGSFVLNISDKIVGKYQNLFVFKLVIFYIPHTILFPNTSEQSVSIAFLYYPVHNVIETTRGSCISSLMLSNNFISNFILSEILTKLLLFLS